MKKLSKFVLCAACASLAGIVISACPKLSVDGPYVCQNGTPVAGLAPQQPTTKCAACNVGYRLDGDACAANAFACVNGTAAAGTPVEDQTPRCAACNSGYRLRGTECMPNRYFCANGVAKEVDGQAPADFATGCASCDPRYHLVERVDGAICEANAYVCANGTPAGGLSINRETRCAECDVGYHLDDNKCVENVHTCRNGTVKSGRPAKEYDQEFCVSCAASYSLYTDAVTGSQTCAGTEYVCFNGMPTDDSLPATPGTQSCKSCDRGFRLTGARCVQNEYTCSNGRAARGTPSNDNAVRCAACDRGYFLDGFACKSSQGFTVGEYVPRGMTAIGSTLYMIGNGTDRLYTVDYTTGVATRVGSVRGFGTKWRPNQWHWCQTSFRDSVGDYCLGEWESYGLGSVNGQLYMMGFASSLLHRLDHTTGLATPVVEPQVRFWSARLFGLNSTLYSIAYTNDRVAYVDLATAKHWNAGRRTPSFGVGVSGVGHAGVTAMDGVVYLLGRYTRQLYTLDIPSGMATKVGTAPHIYEENYEPSVLAAVDGNLYMADRARGQLLIFDLTTGTAKPVGGAQ